MKAMMLQPVDKVRQRANNLPKQQEKRKQMSNRINSKKPGNTKARGVRRLRSRKEKQQGIEVVILEQMVPENHLLRKNDSNIDFSFIKRLCAPLYSENTGLSLSWRSCSVCCLWAICTESVQNSDWKKKIKCRTKPPAASIESGDSVTTKLMRKLFRKFSVRRWKRRSW